MNKKTYFAIQIIPIVAIIFIVATASSADFPRRALDETAVPITLAVIFFDTWLVRENIYKKTTVTLIIVYLFLIILIGLMNISLV